MSRKICLHGIVGIEKCKDCVRLRKRAGERKRLLNPETRDRCNANSRRWKEKNANHCRAYTRKKRGIPVFDGKTMSGVCPICMRSFSTLVPDHDHLSGKFRGWVCGVCNRMMGVYETLKTDGRLDTILQYLERT